MDVEHIVFGNAFRASRKAQQGFELYKADIFYMDVTSLILSEPQIDTKAIRLPLTARSASSDRETRLSIN